MPPTVFFVPAVSALRTSTRAVYVLARDDACRASQHPVVGVIGDWGVNACVRTQCPIMPGKMSLSNARDVLKTHDVVLCT